MIEWGMPRHKSHAPLGGDPKKWNRTATQAFREGISPDTIFEMIATILQGHDPVLVRDERCVDGWRVTWDANEVAPTMRDKQWALDKALAYRDGLPVQSLALDEKMRQISLAAGSDTGSLLLALPAESRARILEEVVRARMLASGEPVMVEDVIEAEIIEDDEPTSLTPEGATSDPDEA